MPVAVGVTIYGGDEGEAADGRDIEVFLLVVVVHIVDGLAAADDGDKRVVLDAEDAAETPAVPGPLRKIDVAEPAAGPVDPDHSVEDGVDLLLRQEADAGACIFGRLLGLGIDPVIARDPEKAFFLLLGGLEHYGAGDGIVDAGIMTVIVGVGVILLGKSDLVIT